ncbi:hypothetical protein COV06_01675 [Candidatus Uhrbacteria bacterium CG10_big_fil_rev_8_21_14_0_10_50_16]|uniref:Uncharacterized protein n=1 Tax=Candidatus Uhrbacteria bacterium CG10_big_fil_rev_8_21_14_0_10_50_16 TaxID=1975039 RepID=A0A2H0RNK8_9BACT|nr:MAG: hypothetical protein COV06_01675 [Candidatus Uhrbacteria bacterium CG10_big_fil_rev_8_21_14_0_10_50_16]
MKNSIVRGLGLFAGGIASACIGLVMGGYVGILTINLFPNQCIDGKCFSFLGYVGWEALGALGGIVGVVAGVVVFVFVVMRTKK